MSVFITLSALALTILYIGLIKSASKALLPFTLFGLLIAITASLTQWNISPSPIFNGMILYDNPAIIFSTVTILITFLIILLSKDYFEGIGTHIPEYYAMIIFSLIGMITMLTYHNLTMLFIGTEIMSLSLYILAGIKKNLLASNEAALKYFLMGAFSTGIFLLGITLLYGVVGSFDLYVIKDQVTRYAEGRLQHVPTLLHGGILLIMIGILFKVGVVPFHFWVPDVYEGSPSLITTYMSTASKIVGFAAFLRLFSSCFIPLQALWVPPLLLVTTLTLLIGNLTALCQYSLKRMLTYSSISHAGYMLFAIIALSPSSVYSIFIYAVAYSLASITSFAMVILLQKQKASDSFECLNGLATTNPYLAFATTIAMLSLAGIPLTAGFIGKYILFSNVIAQFHVWLVVFAVINAAIAVFYYFRVIVSMYFKKPLYSNQLKIPLHFSLVLSICTVITMLIGLYPSLIIDLI